MPSEAQLKAQMQAAIAAKKKKAIETESDAGIQEFARADLSPAVGGGPRLRESSTQNYDSESQTTHVLTNPVPEEKLIPASTKAEPASPSTLTFFGQTIRFTTHRKDVYFAIDDILPLADNADSQNMYIEFKNQPSTRDKAESLVKTLTFTSEAGTEKLDGAKAAHIIEILRELRLSSPGPLARWLDEISTQFKPTDDKSAE